MKFRSEIRRQIKLRHAVKKDGAPRKKQDQDELVFVTSRMFHKGGRCRQALCTADLFHLSSAGKVCQRGGSILFQSQLDEAIGSLLLFEAAACRDNFFESLTRYRQAGDDFANPARLFTEIPNEFAPRGLLRVTLAVFGEDGDPRSEKRHIVRRNNRHAFHQVENFRRIGTRGQQREAAFYDAVRAVVARAPRLCFADVFSSRRKRGAGILRLEPIDHGFHAIDVFVPDVVLLAKLHRDVNMRDVVTGNRIDAVERLEKYPFFAETGGNFGHAGLRVANKAISELSSVIAGIDVIEARFAFERSFTAWMS